MHGGRFNPKGTQALYASLDPLTALAEANQVGELQPTTLVAYRPCFHHVFDSRDLQSMSTIGLNEQDLDVPDWRLQMLDGKVPRSHNVFHRLIAAGYDALLVRSFAPKAQPGSCNLVIWRWNTGPSNRLDVIDDEMRLKRF